MKKIPLILYFFSSFLFFFCSSNPVPNSLDPESKEFLSKARYLITKKERQTLLALPASERKTYVDEYWKQRDPDPSTEANEFKDEYFRRIDEANFMFKEGTTPGWLQDRGRYYILLGPPDTRETYPRGVTFYGIPTEIWYYGFFPVVFVDPDWNGNYRLDPLSAEQVGILNETQVMLLPKARPEKGKETIDASFEVKPLHEGEAVLQLKIPYKDIWFDLEGKTLKAVLELTAKLTDSVGKKAWEHHQNYSLTLDQKELLKVIRGTYPIDVLVKATPGTYALSLALKNTADGSQTKIKDKLTL
jgi:GWxTD domain-containing protein